MFKVKIRTINDAFRVPCDMYVIVLTAFFELTDQRVCNFENGHCVRKIVSSLKNVDGRRKITMN